MPIYRDPSRYVRRSSANRVRRSLNAFTAGNEGQNDPDVYTHTSFGEAEGSGVSYQFNVTGHVLLIDSRSSYAKASAAAVTNTQYRVEMTTPIMEIRNTSNWDTGPSIVDVLVDINRTTSSPVFDAITIYGNPGTPGEVLISPGDYGHGGSTSTRVRWQFTNGIPANGTTNYFNWYQDIHTGVGYDFRDIFWDGVNNASIRVEFDDGTIMNTDFIDFTDTDSFYTTTTNGVVGQSVPVWVPSSSDYHGWYSVRHEYVTEQVIEPPTTFANAENEASQAWLELPGCQQYGNKPLVIRHAGNDSANKRRVRVFAKDGETIEGESTILNLPGVTDNIELLSDGVSDWETVWREERAIAHVSKGSLLLATTIPPGLPSTGFNVHAPTTVVLVDASNNNAIVRIDYPEQFEAGILIIKRIDNSANVCNIVQTGFNYFEDGVTTTKSLTSQYETLILFVDYSSGAEGICHTAFQGVP